METMDVCNAANTQKLIPSTIHGAAFHNLTKLVVAIREKKTREKEKHEELAKSLQKERIQLQQEKVNFEAFLKQQNIDQERENAKLQTLQNKVQELENVHSKLKNEEKDLKELIFQQQVTVDELKEQIQQETIKLEEIKRQRNHEELERKLEQSYSNKLITAFTEVLTASLDVGQVVEMDQQVGEQINEMGEQGTVIGQDEGSRGKKKEKIVKAQFRKNADNSKKRKRNKKSRLHVTQPKKRRLIESEDDDTDDSQNTEEQKEDLNAKEIIINCLFCKRNYKLTKKQRGKHKHIPQRFCQKSCFYESRKKSNSF